MSDNRALKSNVGAGIIRKGCWGMLYYNIQKGTLKNSIGKYLGPHIKFQGRGFRVQDLEAECRA